MFSKSQSPNYQLDFCRQDNGLLFQFMLTEVLKTLQIGQQLLNLTRDIEKLSSPSTLNSVNYHLHSLTGYRSNTVDSQEHQNPGILVRLKEACLFMSERIEDIPLSYKQIYAVIDKAWFCGLQLQSLLHVEKQPDNETLIYWISTLWKRINRIALMFTEKVIEFKDNENVLFFLARYPELSRQLFYTEKAKRILRKHFPNGISGLEKIVLEKYRERGFEHMLPHIQKMFATLSQ